MANLVIGLYNEIDQAYQVISHLRQAGFDMSDISLLSNATRSSRQGNSDQTSGGMFSDMKRHKLSGIGEVYARGPLTRYLSGDTKFSDALQQMGAQREEASAYLEALRRGNTLVALNADERRSDEAVQIMSRVNSLPTERLSQHWRESGWQGFDERAQPYTAQDIDREQQTILPIIEEEMRVGKREVSRGGVRVHSRMVENPVEKTVDLREERVNVERRRVDRPVGEGDLDAFREGTFEVRETGEEAIVDKQARVVEEVVVDKTVEQRQQTVRGTERRTEVDVEQVEGGHTGGEFGRFDADFRRHYETNLSRSGGTYESFQPAYRYGYEYAGQYGGRNWSDVEMGARQRWESQHPESKWEQIKDAVREGFERARRKV